MISANFSIHRKPSGHLFAVAAMLMGVCTLHAQNETAITPTWETQKQARMHMLGIPAPRGQITDRNGKALAQNRIGYNLGIDFPVPLDFSDAQAVAYAREKISVAENILKRPIAIDEKKIIEHYNNRGLLTFEILQDLLPSELASLNRGLPDGLTLRPVYIRFYPNGSLAGHVLGYVGRMGRALTSPIKNNELLWPEFEGRDGLEQTFNAQLTGKVGQMNIAFDALGNQVSEVIAIPPQAGNNVVTTLDEDMQRAAEEILAENSERGSIVVMDPRNGDILVLASWPVFNPNTFVPFISSSEYRYLQEDPDIPLLPRAFRSAYPAGSIYKIVIGLAALESGTISPYDEFSCPTVYYVGNLDFRNWKKEHAGSLNFAEALTQSCNTWFYQVGIKTGSAPIVDWSHELGFGRKTNIPLRAEASGRVPTDDYMMKVYNRPIMDGDIANISIGQGDILVSPLQMAQAMMVVANGGTLYQPRLVRQVQDFNNRIVTAYNQRARSKLQISPTTVTELHRGMVDVVHSGMGTAAQARVKGIKLAGKTGTAQWGPKAKEKTAAWFVGYGPDEDPRFAFAALYEGNPNDHDVHGGSHAAPLIGKLMKRVVEIEEERAKAKEEAEKPEDETGENPVADDGETPENSDSLAAATPAQE